MNRSLSSWLYFLVVGVFIAISFLSEFLYFSLAQYDMYGFLLFILFLLGIPHGAFDAILFFNRSKLDVSGLLKFSIIYLLVTIICIALWFILPAFCLCVFLIISIYHFSQNWRNELPFCLRLYIAIFIICAPAFIYQPQIIVLFEYLLVTQEHAFFITQSMRILTLLSFVISLFYYQYLAKQYIENIRLLSELMLLILSAILLEPLIHFIFYFCFLHSLKHISDVFTKTDISLKTVLVIVIPTAFLAIFMMFFIYSQLHNVNLLIDMRLFIQVLFIGLFGLTVAHMCVVQKWHLSLNNS